MISVSQIYDTILALSRKDKRGLSFSPDDYNNVLVQVNQRIWRLNYHNFEASKLSTDEMSSFKILDFPIVLDANGVGALPTNYFHLAGDPWYSHLTEGRRKIDLVTTLEFGSREMDYFSKSSALYPLCYMGYSSIGNDMAITVSPATCTPIYVSYLRQTVDPFLDYYVNNSSLNITYMAQGVTVAVPLGSTSRSGIAGPTSIASLTKDFEWHSHDIPAIIAQLIQVLGLSLPDEMLVQVGNSDEIKVEKE